MCAPRARVSVCGMYLCLRVRVRQCCRQNGPRAAATLTRSRLQALSADATAATGGERTVNIRPQRHNNNIFIM